MASITNKTDPMTNHPKLMVKSKNNLLLVTWNNVPNDATACELLMTRSATFEDWAKAEKMDVGKKSSIILYDVESGIYCLKLKIVMQNNINVYSNEEYAFHIYTEKVGCSSVPSSLKDYISSSYSSERVTSVTPSSTSFRSNASTTSENSFIEQRRLHMFSSSTSASSSTDNILDAVDHDTLEDESLTDEKDDLLNQCLLAIKELKKEVDEQKAKVVILEEVVLDQEKTTEMFKKEHAKVLILEKVVLDQEKTTEILKKEHEKEKTAYDNLLKKATNRIMQLQKKRVESGKGGKKQQKKSVKPAPSDTMTELKELLKSLKT